MNENLLDHQARNSLSIARNRAILVNEPNPGFVPNSIHTAKYNWLTFLPKNLWIQFHRLANIYFLIAAIMQCIPQISVSQGVPNILFPLAIVLIVSAVKDGLEDSKRKKSDKQENWREVERWHEQQWETIHWQDLWVGEIVRVHKNEFLPADLVLLTTSHPKGAWYIETKNIDGESALKYKIANKRTQNFEQLSGVIQCDEPNVFIYQFDAVYQRTENDVMLFSQDNFLPRGCSVKNIDWWVGLVVATGHETKIMMNSVSAKSKFSLLEQRMNRQIIYIFIFQILVCIVWAIFYSVFWNIIGHTWYLDLQNLDGGDSGQSTLRFFSWFLLFNNFVPISLMITLEMVKFIQALFISWDLSMYHEETDTPANVQSSNLNEELGQIHHVFSDKTGTLTCNVMNFKKLSLGVKAFGLDDTKEVYPNVSFRDESFYEVRNEQQAQNYLLHLALCHTIVRPDQELLAESPDELAMVRAAEFFGTVFVGREDDVVTLDNQGQQETYNVLEVVEFSSERRCMSVLVQTADDTATLFCKGADSALRKKGLHTDERLWTNVDTFASEGLRTFVLGKKDLPLDEATEWAKKYSQARADKEKNLMASMAKEVESNLTIIGVTAIEDKLQDHVPDTIVKFRNAGIKVWVLTGDKIETAINIAYSCSLISSEMHQIRIDGKSTEPVRQQLKQAMEVSFAGRIALIVSGKAFLRISTNDELLAPFLNIVNICEVVVACRVSPKQKAEIVTLVRENEPTVRTMAIGDGANDVNMIIAAHVGIGIAGVEGRQAARASDFSISQFSYLQTLVFVHGRENYRRNANLVCYNFYKNLVLVLPFFWYGFVSAFSGVNLYNSWLYQGFNVFFASLPIILYAVFDKEHEPFELINDQKLYKIGFLDTLFGTKVFWRWVIEGVYVSLINATIMIFTVNDHIGYDHGRTTSLYVAGVGVYFLVITAVNIKVFILSYSHYWFTVLIQVLSVLIFPFFSWMVDSQFPIMSLFLNYNSRGGTSEYFDNAHGIFAWIAALVLGFTITFCIQNLIVYLRELKQNTAVDKRDDSIQSINKVDDIN